MPTDDKTTSPGRDALRAWEVAAAKRDTIYAGYQAACRVTDKLYQEVVRLGREEGWHR